MKTTLLIASVLSIASLSFAAEGDKKKEDGKRGGGNPGQTAEMRLEKLDTDDSGTISLKEFSASKIAQGLKEKRGPKAVQALFSRIDKSGDGELNKGELAAMHAGRQGGNKGPGKPGAGKPGNKQGGGNKGKAQA